MNETSNLDLRSGKLRNMKRKNSSFKYSKIFLSYFSPVTFLCELAISFI